MYLYNYLICAIALMILAAIVWHSAYMDERKNRLFMSGIICNILTLLGYVGRGLFNDGNHFLLNYCTNFVIYLSATLLAYSMLLTGIKKNGVLYRITTVLEVIIILLVCSSPLTHMMFYVDNDGFYQRGIINSVFFVNHAFFVFLWIVSLAVNYRRVELSKKLYIVLLGVFEITAIVIQMYASDFKVIYIAAAFIMSIYYAFMMEVEGRYDQMTGVYSKRFYYSEMGRLSPNDSYIVFMLDGNGLKAINDTKGHEYGDLVIKTVGQVAWSVFNSRAMLFRIGGDEFVGFSTSMKPGDMPVCIEKIRSGLVSESEKAGFEISTSIGYAIHRAGEEFLDTLHRADENMYNAKKKYYEKNGRLKAN